MTQQLVMPRPVETGGLEEALAQLTFTRTVDRSLLHRSALSEVFVTDSRPMPDSRYLVAAQLPPSHAYYSDQLLDRSLVDPLLLMECCRQAETYGGHVYRGIDRDHKFILRSWSMRLPGLLDVPVGGEPAELSMVVDTRSPQQVPGRVRSLSYDISMSLDGVAVGDVVIDVGYLSDKAYDYLRTRRRTGVAPSSTQVTATPATVIPSRVGRRNPANVLLRDAAVHADHAVAEIRLPVENRSMFDHAQDHLPGMVLTEAARQLCVFAGAALFGASPAQTTMVGFDLAFTRYAELDSPTSVQVRPSERTDEGLASVLPTVRAYEVSFHQDGEVIAGGEMFTATLPQPAEHPTPDTA